MIALLLGAAVASLISSHDPTHDPQSAHTQRR